MVELTFVMIKPDAHHLIGEIFRDIQELGDEDDEFRVFGLKTMRWTKKQAAKFYAQHRDQKFFDELTTFMSGGDINVMVLQGENIIKRWRDKLGHTHPLKALPETIRGKYGTKNVEPGPANVAHGSDSFSSVDREINLVYSPLERMMFEESA